MKTWLVREKVVKTRWRKVIAENRELAKEKAIEECGEWSKELVTVSYSAESGYITRGDGNVD